MKVTITVDADAVASVRHRGDSTLIGELIEVAAGESTTVEITPDQRVQVREDTAE